MNKIHSLLYGKIVAPIIIAILLLTNCYLGQGELASFFQYVGLIISPLLIVSFCLYKGKKSFIIYFVLYCIGLLVACLNGEHSDARYFFITYSNIIASVLYFYVGLNIATRRVILSANLVYFVLIAVNFLTILLYPNGLYESITNSSNWFFRYDNLHIMMYLPALIIGYLSTKYDKRFMGVFVVENLIVATCVFYCRSATSMIAYALLLSYFIFHKFYDKRGIFNAKNYFIVYLLIFVFIVLLRMQDSFSWLIEDTLGKDITFTGRTTLWDNIVPFIKKKLFTGYGIEETTYFRLKMGNAYYTHAHNTFYDVLYKGGLIALIPHITMMVAAVKKVARQKSAIAKTIAFSLLSLFVMLNFEAREEKMGFYIIILIAYCAEAIVADIMKLGRGKYATKGSK